MEYENVNKYINQPYSISWKVQEQCGGQSS